MSETPVPAIALLASQPAKRKLLADVLGEFGYRVVFASEPERLDCAQLAAVSTDAWLLELAEESELADWLLGHSPVPVLLGTGEIPDRHSEDYPRWKRRLYSKLIPLLGSPPRGQEPELSVVSPGQSGKPAARSVWVLAASLGGPAAVKSFLDALPADLPVAFIYAQHIDPGFEYKLPQILGRHNDWRFFNCEEGSQLHEGEVMIAPISRAIEFGPGGEVRLTDKPWPGAYQPAIEVLLDEVVKSFSPGCGAIIFSGMGEDGVAACGRMHGQGMQVWTQSADSAACATMPQAVQLAGFSTRQGSPEELAMAMRQWIDQELLVAL